LRSSFHPILRHDLIDKAALVELLHDPVVDQVLGFYALDLGIAALHQTDDVGRARNDTELVPRARQNVLLELGYFIAKLGRERVCALKRGEVLIPSDFAGVVWEDMDGAGGWKSRLGRELEAAGQVIDWNKVMRA